MPQSVADLVEHPPRVSGVDVDQRPVEVEQPEVVGTGRHGDDLITGSHLSIFSLQYQPRFHTRAARRPLSLPRFYYTTDNGAGHESVPPWSRPSAVGQLAVAAPQSLVLASVLTLVFFGIGWVLAAGLVYLVSRYFGPNGSFRRLLAFVGWGQAPTLVPAVAATAYIAWAVFTVPDIATEAAAESWIRSTFVENRALTAIDYAGFPFAVWSVYLWLLAAEHGLDTSRR
ncbi:hypothetical protein BRC60_09710 [Halobacteriales archaeon QH_1_68_42]|nr:MAG: hypothetical protein BRC60_09710 [Halobacteriales archaeon QH_1_68_42]